MTDLIYQFTKTDKICDPNFWSKLQVCKVGKNLNSCNNTTNVFIINSTIFDQVVVQQPSMQAIHVPIFQWVMKLFQAKDFKGMRTSSRENFIMIRL